MQTDKNSSRNKSTETLVTRKIMGVIDEAQAHAFLVDVANVTDETLNEDVDLPKFMLKKYGDILDFLPDNPELRKQAFCEIRNCLRQAWVASNQRIRDWWLFAARLRRAEWSSPDEHHSAVLSRVPDIVPFEAAVYHLQRVSHIARHCKNPECISPFFLGKKNQLYCSSECAVYGQREAKRNWWADNRARKEA